jgi:hypothetical protein
LRYEEGAQVEIISPGGTRILIDVANPSALSRPATEQDVLLTTHTHADHYNRAFVKAFTGQQLLTRQGTLTLGDVIIQGIASVHNVRDPMLAENGTNYIYERSSAVPAGYYELGRCNRTGES